MPAKSDPRDQAAGSEYFYRRASSARGVLRAVGFGLTVGVAAFYVAKLYLERTPLTVGRAPGVGARQKLASMRTRHG